MDETASPENPLSSDPPIEVRATTVKSSDSHVTPVSSKRRRSGGRDDCWSEEATEVLIDAWGERFLDLKRGNLKQQHWKQVADIVNSERINNTSLKSDIQCKNRIDTVKKKFKQEKAKVALTGDHSRWVFFNKLKHLIGEVSAAATPTPLLRQGGGVKRSGDSSSTRWHFRKRVASETESESDPDLSNDDDDDSLPPSPPPVKILDRVTRGEGGKEVGEVVMAIMGFAECYEKVETLKIKQMVELDKERMKFAKELELQRMQFFKSQLEMLRNSQQDDDGERRKSRHNVKDNGNVS